MVPTPNLFRRMNGSTYSFIDSFKSNSFQERVSLDSILDDQTLCHKDGSLSSMIKIIGSGPAMEKGFISNLFRQLQSALKPIIRTNLHAIEIAFVKDPYLQIRKTRSRYQTILKQCKLRGIELDHVIQDQAQNEILHSQDEELFLTLFSKNESGLIKRSEPTDHKIQSNGIKDIARVHINCLDALTRNLWAQGHRVAILDSWEYLKVVERGLYPDTNHTVMNSFKQSIPVDFLKEPQSIRNIIPFHPIELFDSETVCLDKHRFAGFDVIVTPENLVRFNELILALSKTANNIPWRCVFKIGPVNFLRFQSKEQFTRLFSFTNPRINSRIRRAFEFIQRSKENNHIPVGLRISFSTWEEKHKETLLQQNANQLQKTIEQWGNTILESKSGDQITTVFSTIPGLSTSSTATAALAPLEEALSISPIIRNKSPWNSGHITFNSIDKLPWYYQRGSHLQTNWLEIIMGGSGSGKSVALNSMNLKSILEEFARLQSGFPDLVVIDVGNSSRGLIQMLQGALSGEQRPQVAHIELKMLPEYSVNIFDTPLGFRAPPNRNRNFIMYFLSILVGSDDMDLKYPFERILGSLIDEVYKEVSEQGSPKRYHPGLYNEVDTILNSHGFEIHEYTSWWEIVDWLYSNGFFQLAIISQRQAVPTLTDLISAAHSPKIISLFSDEKDIELPSIPKELKQIVLGLSSAQRDYPLIANTTQFDLEHTRVVSIDVGKVLKPDLSREGQKHSALMYMLATKVATSNWETEPEEIQSAFEREILPQEFQSYHFERAEQSSERKKILCIDEFHRASVVKEITQFVLLEAREGRKRNVQITLCSQFLEDFPPQLLQLASTLLFFGKPSPIELHKLQKLIPLHHHLLETSDTEASLISGQGASVLGIFKTKMGTFQERLQLHLSPQELWEFTTMVEDVQLRDRVYRVYGISEGRRKLAQLFPDGSAKNRMESIREYRRENSLSNQDDSSPSEVQEEILNQLERV